MQAIKCVVVGDGAVGKTCAIMRFSQNSFPDDYLPTVIENLQCTLMVDEMPYNLGLWDTAVQEENDHLRPLSYLHTDVFLVLFSVVSPVSFQNISAKWIPEVKHHCPKTPILLVGTKIDLREDPATLSYLSDRKQVPVEYDEGKRKAKEMGCISYIECSSMDGNGFEKVFSDAVRSAVNPKLKKKRQKSVNKKDQKCNVL